MLARFRYRSFLERFASPDNPQRKMSGSYRHTSAESQSGPLKFLQTDSTGTLAFVAWEEQSSPPRRRNRCEETPKDRRGTHSIPPLLPDSTPHLPHGQIPPSNRSSAP